MTGRIHGRRRFFVEWPSRSAWIGVTRVARTAGIIAASTVTPSPTATAQMTVRSSIGVPVDGMPKPTASNSAVRPAANRMPPAKPRIVAMMPTISASPSTAPSTCRREAPIVRSIPNSRVRCATVIV